MPTNIRFSISICLLLFARANLALAQKQVDLHVAMSNELIQGQVVQNDFTFFDVNDTIAYISIQSDSKQLPFPFFLLEVKRKSHEQDRLKPILEKKIVANSKANCQLPLPKGKLNSGNYHLVVYKLQEDNTKEKITSIPFQVLRTEKVTIVDIQEDIEPTQVDINKTFVAKYELVQLQKNIAALLPIARDAELRVVKQATEITNLTDLKQFFYNFWYNRSPSHPEAAWKQYAERLNEVAKRYGNATAPGYETDRGRIYLQYGEPDKVERILNERNALPHEIWVYNNYKNRFNVRFLFFQPGMVANQMILLHSSEPNEVINPDWKTYLYTDAFSGDAKLTHKAFEYFESK